MEQELQLALFEVLDEQVIVNFTGRVNVLNKLNRQFLGMLILKDGQIYRCQYNGGEGLKAFYNIIIDSQELVHHDFIVEPEVVGDLEQQIHYPYSVIKNKTREVLQRYYESVKFRPPGHLRLMVDPAFLAQGDEITASEYDLLCAISDWNLVTDVYQHCSLLDYEITNALVSLRKKKALKVFTTKAE